VGARGWRGDRGGREGDSHDDDGRDDGGCRAKPPSSNAVGGCAFRLSGDNRLITIEREIYCRLLNFAGIEQDWDKSGFLETLRSPHFVCMC